MDPPEPAHAQPVEQGVHAAPSRPSGHRRRADRPVPVAADPDDFDVIPGLLRPVPRSGDHPDGRRARIPPAGPALDRHLTAPANLAGRSGSAKRACRPTSRPRSTYNLVQAPRRAAGRQYDQPAHRRRRSPDDDSNRKLDDIEICGFATLLGGAGAETVTKLMGTAIVNLPASRTSGCSTTGARSRRREGDAAPRGPVRYNVRYSMKGEDAARRHDPGGCKAVRA